MSSKPKMILVRRKHKVCVLRWPGEESENSPALGGGWAARRGRTCHVMGSDALPMTSLQGSKTLGWSWRLRVSPCVGAGPAASVCRVSILTAWDQPLQIPQKLF